VAEVQRESPMFCDVHLRLQTHNIGLRHIAYSRLGKYESLVADVAEIMREANVASYTPTALGWDNKARRDVGWTPDARQVTRIESLYAEDYERLGYAGG